MEFLILVSEKDILKDLLDTSGFKYKIIGKNRPTIFRKSIELIRYIFNTLRFSIKFKPDIYFAQALPHFGFVSFLNRAKYYIFEDTEKVSVLHFTSIPFCTKVFTPDCFQKDLGKKHVKVNTYLELFYLHPEYYNPDKSTLEELKLNKNENYVVLRFVSWASHHDIGLSGLSIEIKRKAVSEFSKYAKVFISAENELPADLEKFRIQIPPQKIHDVLNYATLLYGESATMASECAILGTPSIFVHDNSPPYTKQEEKKYGLLFNFSESPTDQELSIQIGVELLKATNVKQEWKSRSKKMLSEKIDVNRFMFSILEENTQ